MPKIKDFIKGLFGSLCPTCHRWYFNRMDKEAIKSGIECIGCDHVRGEMQVEASSEDKARELVMEELEENGLEGKNYGWDYNNRDYDTTGVEEIEK